MADGDDHSAPLDLSSLATSLPEDDSARADPPISSELPAQLRRKMASQMSSQAQDASDSRQELELARLKGGIRQHAINALRRQAVIEAEYLEQENSNVQASGDDVAPGRKGTFGHHGIVTLLLKRGADLGARTTTGFAASWWWGRSVHVGVLVARRKQKMLL
ncbi:hypothetical protein DFH09DRAFT_1333767 [Mycena vulgaris]|nr:hypothetical protein DFH09DRAFT_1333767 [Mycena vulgaris]